MTGIVDAISRHRVSWLLLVPAVILMLVQHVKFTPADLSSVRALAYGASPIAEDVLLRAMRVLPSAGFRQVYGSTESTAVGTFSPPLPPTCTIRSEASCARAGGRIRESGCAS